MAITQDGSQAFAIASTTFGAGSLDYVVESFSRTNTSSRVDINDGNGEPLGAVVVPGRADVSLTVQVGGNSTDPAVGQIFDYAGNKIILTEVALAETQSDYRRFTLSGYEATNTVTVTIT